MSLIAVSPIPGHLWPVRIKCYFETRSSKKTQKVIKSWMFHFGWGRFPYKLCLKWNVLWTQVINYGLKSQLDVVGFGRWSQNGSHCLKGKNILFDIYKFIQQYTHYMQYSRHDEISIGYFEEILFRNLGQKIIPDSKWATVKHNMWYRFNKRCFVCACFC